MGRYVPTGCMRCGGKPKVSRSLCGECFGHCRTCSEPTEVKRQIPGRNVEFYTYCLACREVGAYSADQQYRRDGESSRRLVYRLRGYGITVKQYTQMLQLQDNRCAICRTDRPDQRGYKLVFCVDHDHRTGQVRGLLCQRCNLAIGYVNDDPAVLRAAAVYLEAANA